MAKQAAHSRQVREAELRKVLQEVNAEIRKESKSDTLIVGTGTEVLESPTEWISTGSLALDRIIRGFNPGGIPLGPRYGRIVHIAGDPSTGKSLLLDHLFLGVQKRGGLCCCSETEATRDPHFARSIGLDLDRLTILQGAQTIEEMLDEGLKWHAKIRKRVGPTVPLLWGIDSLDSIEASKSSAHGISEGKGWAYGGGKSEALGVGLKRINARICSQFPTSVVLLNQVRISPQSFSFVTNKYTPGGMA